jgi:peptidoglycan hydrolase-like protein with peptidoglycan-binding domain
MALPYQKAGLTLSRSGPGKAPMVKALQRDLRALGYLGHGIDGNFGAGTEQALRSLQYDLLHNVGASTGDDGAAPVAVTSYNIDPATGNAAVTAVTGTLDQPTAGCIARMLADSAFPKLPSAADPAAENARAMAAVAAISSAIAPTPYIEAIVIQESSSRHFEVPTATDEDNFVSIGLDRNGPPDAITSRGYGLGQYTIYHHPPRPDELGDFILDPVRNVQRAYAELREKFDRWVLGPASRADDRLAEHPLLPLRLCRYALSDARYMRDCRTCAMQARKLMITRGTPVYAGASVSYQPTRYYTSAEYVGVPDRADFLCDWPYALRRYNGSGVNSYHYQARVMPNLLLKTTAGS